MAYTLALPVPIGVTGLTLLASFRNSSGTLHANLRNLACPETGTTGVYEFTTASVDDGYRGSIYFHTGSVSVDAMTGATVYSSAAVYPEDSENSNVKTDTRMATYTQPTGFLATTFGASVGTSTLAAGAQMDLVSAPNATAITAIQAGLSTLTQTQVTGGAYSLASASFAFNAALDFTTTQKAATLARVTLVDTATTLTNLPAITANWLTAAGLADDAVTEIQSGLATAANLAIVDGIVDGILVDTAEIGVAGAGLTAITAPSAAAVADAVWDEVLSGHVTAGTAGAALTAAGAAGDPWSVTLPASYTSGQAGYQFSNMNTIVSQFTAGDFDVVSPVNATGTAIELFRGDDYKYADGRHLLFSSTSFPVLTGGTVLLKIGSDLSITGTVTSATACRFDVTAAQTAALSDDAYPYEVQATLVTSGNIVTLAVGTARISGQI